MSTFRQELVVNWKTLRSGSSPTRESQSTSSSVTPAESRPAAKRAPARSGPSDLILRIFQPKAAVKGEQLGYAAMTPEGGAYITVFVNPSEQKARVGNLSNGIYLGHAVAHEVGHLLLGPNSHSTAGIMRPVWRPVDEDWMGKRALLFDAGQASRMQSSLVARLRR